MKVFVALEGTWCAPAICGIYKRLEDAQQEVNRDPTHRWVVEEDSTSSAFSFKRGVAIMSFEWISDEILNIFLFSIILFFIFLCIAYPFALSEQNKKANACANANGIYMEVYSGYECISKESLKPVEVK